MHEAVNLHGALPTPVLVIFPGSFPEARAAEMPWAVRGGVRDGEERTEPWRSGAGRGGADRGGAGLAELMKAALCGGVIVRHQDGKSRRRHRGPH